MLLFMQNKLYQIKRVSKERSNIAYDKIKNDAILEYYLHGGF